MTARTKPNGKHEGSTNGKYEDGTNGTVPNVAADAAPERDGIPVPAEKRCGYATQKGTPCRAARRKDSRYCIFHDEDFQEQRTRLRVGRRFFSLRATPDSAEGIHELLRRNIEAVARNKITPRVANSISYAAQLMIINRPALENARTVYNIREDSEHQMAQIAVSTELDRVEKEIKEAGEDAFPLDAARAHAEQVRSAPKPQERPPETHAERMARLGYYPEPAGSESNQVLGDKGRAGTEDR